jgi:pimeloyl-ACP methyl ester carboxylesterase
MTEILVERSGVELSGDEAGEGVPVVLLHGLTATRRYVVMGSRALERSGHRVIAYDARGHGRSSPAPTSASYTYEDLG